MTVRRLALSIALVALLAFGVFLFLHDAERGDRVRFVLYRPAVAQFFIDRSVAPGDGLDYVHDAKDAVAFGAPGDIGLACAQSDRANPGGFRTFAEGAWHLAAGQERRASGDLVLGQAGDVPFCADFDGDGGADNGVFRDGAWYVATKRDGRPDVRFAFGAAGDRPVVLNVKGAGNATDRKNVVYGVYRRGMWCLDTRGTGSVDAAHAFGGLPQDVPLLIPRWSRTAGALPAYSLAIFRDGTWHIKPDPDGAQTLSFSFGAAGDVPGFVR
jgi:hypothetical protein